MCRRQGSMQLMIDKNERVVRIQLERARMRLGVILNRAFAWNKTR